MLETLVTDILVVGSGAGGLCAAITARELGADVIVIEKSDKVGGTSATSGGGIWVPNSHLITEQGETDDPEMAVEYLMACIGERASREHLETYVARAPEMMRFVEDHADIRFIAGEYADYYPDLPGARKRLRSLDPVPFDAGLLGEDFATVRAPHPQTVIFGFTLTMGEAATMTAKLPGWRWVFPRLFASYYLDLPFRLKTKRHRRLTLGNALIGRSLYALKERGVKPMLNTALEELEKEDGAARFALVTTPEGKRRIIARRGIVLAAGGFEHNDTMREQYLTGRSHSEWSGTPGHNTGDAITAAKDIGATLGNMDAAWYAPSVRMPGDAQAIILFTGRASPGVYIVDSTGHRFLNEAINYDETGRNLSQHDDQGWIIFDSRARKNYQIGPLLPGSVSPDRKWCDAIKQVVYKADSLAELAAMTGIDAQGLEETQNRMRRYAQSGVDEDFGKGGNDYERLYGDATVTPNPCLAPIDTPPFYAFKVFPGDIGTKGGVTINTHGQAIDDNGDPIAGLYAVGNSSASIMGQTYPGAGVTIGPAMTFGYLAVRHALGQLDTELQTVT